MRVYYGAILDGDRPLHRCTRGELRDKIVALTTDLKSEPLTV
jgi:hypothetical protein